MRKSQEDYRKIIVIYSFGPNPLFTLVVDVSVFSASVGNTPLLAALHSAYLLTAECFHIYNQTVEA